MKSERNSETPSKWKPEIPFPSETSCRTCGEGKGEIATGFVPVCIVSPTGRAHLVSATCDCARGAYEAQFRDKRDESRHRGERLERFTILDAQNAGLLDSSAETYRDHWRYAKTRELTLSGREDFAAMFAETKNLVEKS